MPNRAKNPEIIAGHPEMRDSLISPRGYQAAVSKPVLLEGNDHVKRIRPPLQQAGS